MSGPPAGTTLAEALERGAFHPLRAVHAGRDVAAILAETHRKGLVHGHVGPEDVLLGDDGVVHLSFSEEPGSPPDDVRDLGRMLREALGERDGLRVPDGLLELLDEMTSSRPPSATQVRDALAAMRLRAEQPTGSGLSPATGRAAQPPAAPPPTERDDAPVGDSPRRAVLLGLLSLLLVVVAIALLVLVLGEDDDAPDDGSPAVVPAAVGASASPSSSPAAETGDLVSRIQPPPQPARRLDDAANRLGALTAPQLVALGGDTAANQRAIVAALDDLGFQAAHARAWAREGGTYSVVVYRFDTPRGAAELLARLRRERPGTSFSSRTVPDAVSYSRRNGALHEQAGSFVRGRYFFDITLATPQEEPDHASFDRLLAAQRDQAEDAD